MTGWQKVTLWKTDRVHSGDQVASIEALPCLQKEIDTDNSEEFVIEEKPGGLDHIWMK